MKRKIALAIAAVMTVAMLPMNAMAASSNSLSRTNLSVKNDEILITGSNVIKDMNDDDFSYDKLASGTAVELRLIPGTEVEVENSTILLNIENGKFDENLIDVDPFVYYGLNGLTGEEILDQYNTSVNDDDIQANVLSEIEKFVDINNVNEMPYYIEFINEEQVAVHLLPLAKSVANKDLFSDTKAEYDIALPINTEDSENGAVTVSVDANGSSLTGGNTYTVATVTDSDGSTTASVVSSKVDTTSDDVYNVPDITIKEDVAGTFDGQKVKVKVNGNFKIRSVGKVTSGVNVSDKSAVDYINDSENTDKIHISDASGSARTIEFTLPAKKAFNSSNPASIILTGIQVEAKDDDTYGDINISISGGSGITSQTIKVGERADYGFELKALEEPTTIFAGRTPFGEDADQDDFETAEFEFGETTPGTWLTGRKLEFSVPEGVKIVGYELTDSDNLSGAAKSLFQTADIIDDGTTLRFASVDSDNDASNAWTNKDNTTIALKLYLSASVQFSGDVTVSVSGAGLDADTLTDLVVAKVVTPVSVEAASTKSNIGYKAVETADIKITENAAGALKDGKKVVVKLDDRYSSDIAFDDTNLDATVDGEVEIKNVKVNSSGNIEFQIDGESYSTPSSITLTGIAVGTTRSIPYGSYKITVGGEAIVDNYAGDDVNVDQDSTIPVDSGSVTQVDNVTDDFDLFEDEGFDFNDYLEIITETVTLDGEVRVTIGEKSLVMDGETIEMDAAAYIQTSSNSTMVPLRFVTLALGVDQDAVTDADNSSKIAWDATSKTATIIYSAGSQQKIIQFTAGSAEMVVDGVKITMENGVVAEIVDGRMYVPFRALGQALGVSVTWDAETRTAIYNEK